MADPYNQNPFATQSGGGVSTNSFEDWYNQYYGGNTSGYQPQKRLSDLAYQQPQPRQFSYTNADFSPPQQQMYQAPVQQSYQPSNYFNGQTRIVDGGSNEVRNVREMSDSLFSDYKDQISNAKNSYDVMNAYQNLMGNIKRY